MGAKACHEEKTAFLTNGTITPGHLYKKCI